MPYRSEFGISRKFQISNCGLGGIGGQFKNFTSIAFLLCGQGPWVELALGTSTFVHRMNLLALALGACFLSD